MKSYSKNNIKPRIRVERRGNMVYVICLRSYYFDNGMYTDGILAALEQLGIDDLGANITEGKVIRASFRIPSKGIRAETVKQQIIRKTVESFEWVWKNATPEGLQE